VSRDDRDVVAFTGDERRVAWHRRRMRMRIAALATVLVAAHAAAQPGATTPGATATPAEHRVPPPYAYQPLTIDERELLERGEIGSGEYVAGGLLSIFVGFGVGQLAEGRWFDTGWIFTIGELTFFSAYIAGLNKSNPCTPECVHDRRGDPLTIAGSIGFVGFHLAGIADAFIAPPLHNARLHALRRRLGIVPVVTSAQDGNAKIAGVALQF
jgi:hypothetical protein